MDGVRPHPSICHCPHVYWVFVASKRVALPHGQASSGLAPVTESRYIAVKSASGVLAAVCLALEIVPSVKEKSYEESRL